MSVCLADGWTARRRCRRLTGEHFCGDGRSERTLIPMHNSRTTKAESALACGPLRKADRRLRNLEAGEGSALAWARFVFKLVSHCRPSGRKLRPMLNWLTRKRRWIAGRLLVLVYLFCVLAPAMSLAFADGARAAPCLTEDERGMGIVHVHEHVGRVAQHVHKTGRLHDHASP